MVMLPEISLGPKQAIEVDLTALYQATSFGNNFEVASVEVTNSGAPGSLIGSIYGVDGDTETTCDVRLLLFLGVESNLTSGFRHRANNAKSSCASLGSVI